MIFGEDTFAEVTFAGQKDESTAYLFRRLLNSVQEKRTFLVELVLRQLSD